MKSPEEEVPQKQPPESNPELKSEHIEDQPLTEVELKRIRQLSTIYAQWKTLPEEGRSPFNTTWIEKNRGHLVAWMRKNGGIKKFVVLIGGDIKNDFQRTCITDRTVDTAVLELSAAHERWKNLSKASRGTFGSAWLKKNESRLISWIQAHGGLVRFITLASGDVASDFNKNIIYHRTPEMAIVELRSAHAEWKELPVESRGPFNLAWLQRNKSGLSHWMFRNGGTIKFITLASGDVASDFNKNIIYHRTPEMAIADLRVVHTIWKTLPIETRGPFNISWLQKYASAIQSWCKKNGGVDKFITLAGGDVAADFQRMRVFDRQSEIIIARLRAAHTQWRNLSEIHRPIFGVGWLKKNAPQSYRWMKRGGGVDKFITLAGGDVASDFQKMKIMNRTPEMVIIELRAAHAEWKESLATIRGDFNNEWLLNNNKSLVAWFYKHGGAAKFITLAGGDVAKDFTRRGDVERKETELKNFFTDIARDNTIDAHTFRTLIALCGASRSVSILFRFRPDYQSIPVERVQETLAEYLGEFLATRFPLVLDNLGDVAPYLDDQDLQEGIFETIKEACIPYYFAAKRANPEMTDAFIIDGYIHGLREKIARAGVGDVFTPVVNRVEEYYLFLLEDMIKPARMVDQLKPGRAFPDMSQRINVHEIKEKKRLLIADEMGTGKTASVIFAKESIGLKCALVVVPSNVIPTWKRHLSDQTPEGGYFKIGRAPRVLHIERAEQMQEAQEYDYVIISQERLDEEYTAALKKISFDMLIVDEVHKVKNISAGVRAQQVMQLSEAIQGDGKYVALLSGTPVPNKVRDVAMILKLLYPERYQNVSATAIVHEILHGDVTKLQGLLFPRMQMKTLAETVDLPPLTEKITSIEMTPSEHDAYEVLMEEDELTATEKMQMLRKFLLYPDLIDATPGIESSKRAALEEKLAVAFAHHDKVVVFVTGIIGGILRGEDALMEKLKIPSGVEVLQVHGEISRSDRDQNEKRFNTEQGKMLLVVSGQAADVGVDFSGGEKVFFFNEPWTEFDKQQQVHRVHREGVQHVVESDTLLVAGTIEQGIHEYLASKHKSIEKLLHGIPLREMEKRALEAAEKTSDDRSAEVNPELAEYCFSVWGRLLKFFAMVKEIGETDFGKFLERYGQEYADCYLELGSRSYQANANRVSAALFQQFIREQGFATPEVNILDVGSGPEMLKRHITDDVAGRVVSMDINARQFQAEGANRVVASALNLPFAEKSFSYVHMGLSWHYTNFDPRKDKYERLQVLLELNRVLKMGGRGIIAMIYSLELADEDLFEKAVTDIGFRVVKEYTGDARSGDGYASHLIVLEKIADAPATMDAALEKILPQHVRGLKIKKNERTLKDSKSIINEFVLNEKQFRIAFNAADRAALEEERQIMVAGQRLKIKFNGIKNVPRAEVVASGFTRVFTGKKYVLFKRMQSASGFIVVK